MSQEHDNYCDCGEDCTDVQDWCTCGDWDNDTACGEVRKGDARAEEGMKCGQCAYAGEVWGGQ